MSTNGDHTGPIDYAVIEFPGNRMTGQGFPILLDLVDRGVIRVLDLAWVTKTSDGHVAGVDVKDLDSSGDFDITWFDGATSGRLTRDDLAEAALVMEPNCSACVLLYENAWVAPFAKELRRGGAELVASGRLPEQAILSAFESAEGTFTGE